jgi:hypothetical protein
MAINNNAYGFGVNMNGYANNQGALLGGTFLDTQGNRLGGRAVFGQNGMDLGGAAVTPFGAMQGEVAFDPSRDQLVLGVQSPFINIQGAIPLPPPPPPPPPPPGAPAPMVVPPQLGFLAGLLPGFFQVG